MIECKHKDSVAQGIQLTDGQALDHFLNCLVDEERLGYWAAMRADAQQGRRCREQEHETTLATRQRLLETQVQRNSRARLILEGNE